MATGLSARFPSGGAVPSRPRNAAGALTERQPDAGVVTPRTTMPAAIDARSNARPDRRYAESVRQCGSHLFANGAAEARLCDDRAGGCQGGPLRPAWLTASKGMGLTC